jgi:SAM-dependent methyltransferase
MTFVLPEVDLEGLRCEIRREYSEVARNPHKGFHFHTGRRLAEILGYDLDRIDRLPRSTVESFAGTGNPFSMGPARPGEGVVDVACGAGLDSLLAGLSVGPQGRVVGVDMTPEMLEKARRGAAEMGLTQVEFRQGYAETLPLPDGWADLVLSNGAVNLCPDKPAVFAEMFRVLKPGGRLQIADIMVTVPVPETARRHIDLWTG